MIELQQLVMAFPFAAVAGAVLPKLVGGVIDNNARKKASSAAKNDRVRARAADRLARRRFEKDRSNERNYAASVTAKDRAYAAGLTASDRRYAAGLYARDVAKEQRDIAAYKRDREVMQRLSNRQAERQTASRGLDFKKLRDDAVAAGFNPLTALGFAQSYSTEIGYHNAGSAVGAAGGVSGGGAGPSHAAATTSAPASAYVSPGGGYQESFNPVLSPGSWIADALDTGIQTYFNTTNEADAAMYEDIAGQVARGQLERALKRQQPQDTFGFNLSKVQPYSPAIGHGAPVLSGNNMYGVTPEALELRTDSLFTPVDLGYGETGWGLNPDREYSEIVQTVGDAAIMAQQGLAGWKHSGPMFTIRDGSPISKVRGAVRAWRGVQKGAFAENGTGTRPVAPIFTQPQW